MAGFSPLMVRVAGAILVVLLVAAVPRATSSVEDQIRVADSLAKASRYDSAIALYGTALPQYEREYGHDDTTTAKLLYKLGTTYRRAREYAAADPLLLRVLEIFETALGEDNPRIGTILNALGNVAIGLERYDDAERYFKRSLALKEASLAEDSPKLAATLTNLADLYRMQARNAEAEQLFLRALNIREKHLKADDPRIAITLKALGDLYFSMGQYQKSADLHQRALAIQKRSLGANHPRLANTINSLANAFHRLGRYDREDSLYIEALKIWEESNHPDAYLARLNLANARFTQGHYRDAEPLLRRTIAEMQARLGESHSQVAYATSLLGNVYWELRRLEDAERMYLQAIEISEQALGDEHPEVAFSLRNLGALYTAMGRFEKAEPLLRRAHDIRRRTLGSGHLRVALSVEALASLYLSQDRVEEADSLLMAAISSVETEYGPDYPVLARLLEILATVRLHQSRFQEGLSLVARSLELCRRSRGETHPLIAKNMMTESELYRGMHKWDSAVRAAEGALQIYRDRFFDNAVVLSERDALQYAGRMRAAMDNYFSCLHDAVVEDNDISNDIGVHQLLASKGAVSDGLFRRKRALATEPDSTTRTLLGRYRQTRAALSDLHVAGPGNLSTAEYTSRLDSLSTHARELEAELSLRSASFKSGEEQREPTASQLMELIPSGSAFLEYMKYHYRDAVSDTGTGRYVVAIVKRDQTPILVDLGDAADIDRLVQRYRRHMLSVVASGRPPSVLDQDEYLRIGRDLARSVFEPLEQYVTDCELLLVAPDGSLNLVSFAGLVDAEGGYLIERLAVHYLLSGRDIIRLESSAPPVSGLLAIGDPDYNATAADRRLALTGAGSSGGTDVERQVADDTATLRGGATGLSGVMGTPLPASRDEVLSAAEVFSSEYGENAEVFMAAEASEDVLKGHASGKRVVHLATHGFFLDGDRPIVGFESGNSGFDIAGENPLLLSGLLLAGANRHGVGATEVGLEDGVLTAEEVASLDLDGTRLVVLSACETGLGAIEQGEGVYGLRRAFQIAGARTIISALWPVSDVMTARTMGHIYQQDAESLTARLRSIQIGSIAALRNSRKADHPSSWGAFVTLGDWR